MSVDIQVVRSATDELVWAFGRLLPQLSSSAGPVTAESLREFCTGQRAHYKIPRYVEIVDEFPMTVTGKIRKVEMREVTAERLGLG